MTVAPEEEKPSAPPALFFHCKSVYEAMEAQARPVYADSGDIEMMVWEGFLTALFDKLNLSIPFFTTVRRELIRMGCIRQLRRGGGTAPSQWEVIKAPTIEAWGEGKETLSPRTIRRLQEQAVQDQIVGIHNRLDIIERVLQIPSGAQLPKEDNNGDG